MTQPEPESEAQLTTLREFAGRALLADPDGTLYLGRHYQVLASRDEGRNWDPIGQLPLASWRRALQPSRLACRLLRQEVRALAHHPDGTLIAANREGNLPRPKGREIVRGEPRRNGRMGTHASDANHHRPRRDRSLW